MKSRRLLICVSCNVCIRLGSFCDHVFVWMYGRPNLLSGKWGVDCLVSKVQPSVRSFLIYRVWCGCTYTIIAYDCLVSQCFKQKLLCPNICYRFVPNSTPLKCAYRTMTSDGVNKTKSLNKWQMFIYELYLTKLIWLLSLSSKAYSFPKEDWLTTW